MLEKYRTRLNVDQGALARFLERVPLETRGAVIFACLSAPTRDDALALGVTVPGDAFAERPPGGWPIKNTPGGLTFVQEPQFEFKVEFGDPELDAAWKVICAGRRR